MTHDKAAELRAAVKAVESGERSAASFYAAPTPATRPAPPGPAAPSAPSMVPGAGAPPRNTPVPAGLPGVLTAGGAPEALAAPAAEALGEGAAEALRADPWLLLGVEGVRPEQADTFARALLGPECGPDDPRRGRALVGWLLESAALAGHTALAPPALSEGLAEHAVPDPEEAVRQAVEDGTLLVFEDALDAGPTARDLPAGPGEAEEAEERPVRLLMGLDRFALAEESLADGLARLLGTRPPTGAPADPPWPDDGSAVGAAGVPPERWAEAAAAAPSPSAAELVRAAAEHGLVAHTGGEAARAEPAALVASARRLGLRAYATTHSEAGRAALSALVAPGPAGPGGPPEGPVGSPESANSPESGAGAPVLTLAELLGGQGPDRTEDGSWALDLLVVCDAPQLDAESAAALVESLPDGARLVLSGDPHLLPSAGAGRVFADLLAARSCPHVVSRTPDPGPIGELVSGVGEGELAAVDAPGKEVVIVPVRDAGEAVHRTVQLVADSVPRALGVPAEQTQVITPRHGGPAGTRALNAALKERLNPGPGAFGGFDPGDRIAHSPAPGRTTLGSVVSGGPDGLQLDCAGHRVEVPPERVGAVLRHGWAITAHQAAGARWPAAVVVLPGDATDALHRAWVYTAFGRGERHLSVVHGAEDALPRAVATRPAPERTTRLRTLLAQATRATVTAGS
ncbi:exodeoxyribonuclease V [Streptomyces sp. AJS327]|uniref:helix-hairpin-helix domain-containing protein n=1 Tax=Streptomyces sp. AJS327 TaxID=2545265 RepID=UPI0015DF7DBC|nr:helix-hairpin-helix domain-containing protein [Streptomyces sp. AJS327]MBA0050668.1 exodeoxyribonuclease V [Streptomyces sp. AJS327]